MDRIIHPDVGRFLQLAYYPYIILVLLLNHYSGNVMICVICLVLIDSPKMIDHGRSKSRRFRRTFICRRYDLQALSGLRLLSLFLSSVGKSSRLYSAKIYIGVNSR